MYTVNNINYVIVINDTYIYLGIIRLVFQIQFCLK